MTPSEPFLMPSARSFFQEHDPVAGGEPPASALHVDRHLLAQFTSVPQAIARKLVERSDFLIGVGENDPALVGRRLPAFVPALDQLAARLVAGRRGMDHAMVAIGIEGEVRPSRGQMPRGVTLPSLALAADLADLDMGQTLAQGAERRAGFDRLQLLGIADQDHLGATAFGFAQDPLQLPRADHAGFVDHQHVLGAQRVAVLRPLMLEARNGARGDARVRLEVLGGDAGEGNPANLEACLFPRLSGHAQHGRFAGPGMADDDTETVPIGDMDQGVFLLVREDEAARFGLGQSASSARLRYPMPSALGHPVGSPMKALFDRNHLLAGEAVLAAPVAAQPHQVRRTLHRRHDPVELLPPVGMAVDEPGEVAAREGRLLVGDGFEAGGRIGNDPVPVLPGNLAVLVQPVGFEPFPGHARRGRADLVLRLELDALIPKGAMIDACFDPQPGQALVDVAGPGFAPMDQQVGPVPLPDLRPEAGLVHRAGREHHMGMGLRLALRVPVPMHIEVGDHAAGDKLARDKIPGQTDPLGLVQFSRMANSTSRASWASFRFSAASTAFHSFSRAWNSAGAFSGVSTSE